MSTGVCRNAACAKSLTAEPIERYPGPGQFCPDCGELLQSVPGGRSTPATNGAAAAKQPSLARAEGGAKAVEQPASKVDAPAATTSDDAPAPPLPEAQGPAGPDAAADGADEPAPGSFAQFRHDLQSAFAEREPAALPLEPAGPFARKPPLLALVAIVAVVGLALVVLRPVMTMSSKATALRVCGSSVTTRVATDILAAYEAKSGARAGNSSVVTGGPCDVQFAAAVPHRGSGNEIARDGVVLIVNPQNPISRVSEAQLRRIVSGEITDWSQLGGARGTIFIVLPAESTDERRAIAGTALRGTRVASRVLHVASSADIVRLVAGPNGRHWLGVVAFSTAVPAKVVPLGAAPVPSAATIADNRYPLTLAVTVHGDGRNAAAGSLIAFARSREAEAIVSRDGFIAKGN